MKFSLRNCALAAMTLAAGVAVAQTPTVTKVWSHDITGTSKTETRFGTGVNGAIYFNQKNEKTVKKIAADGTVSAFATVEGLGTVISSDDAGNLLVGRSFAGVASSTAYTIVKPDGTTQELNITLPEGAAAGRMDQVGRVVGDLLSENGAIYYVCPSANTVVSAVQVKSGAQVTDGFDYYASSTVDAKLLSGGTSTVINPAGWSIDDILGGDPTTMWAGRIRGLKAAVSFDANGELKALPVNCPEGLVTSTSEGFDMFSLGDKAYQVIPVTAGAAYASPFVIADEEGNVIYVDDQADFGDAAQSFGSYCAHKVADNKVELYRYFSCGKGIRATMYTIELPAAQEPTKLYAAGTFQGWKPAEATELTYADGKYTLTLTEADGEFKLSTVKGDWAEFNSGAIGAAPDNYSYMMNVGDTIPVSAGMLGNNRLPSVGNWTITVDLEASTMVLTGESTAKPFVAPEKLYVVGAATNWTKDETIFLALQPEKTANGEYVYTAELANLQGEFKVTGPLVWDDEFNYGGAEGNASVTAGNTLPAWRGSGINFSCAEAIAPAVVTFYLNEGRNLPSYLKVEAGTPVPTSADRAHFAYDLKAEAAGAGKTNISYKSTGDALKAVLVVTNEADEADVTTVEMGRVKKGENTFTFDNSALKNGASYKWAVEMHGYTIPENNFKVIEAFEGANNNFRSAVVTFDDPRYEAFGYTVLFRNVQTGATVYNPAGEVVNTELFKDTPLLAGATNYSNPMRGTNRGNDAVFAAWGDAAYGVTAFNVVKPTEEPLYSVFEGQKASNGLISTDSIGIGSGTPCVAFQGEGENERMFTFDEDLLGNNIAMYESKGAKTIAVAPANWGGKALLANTKVDMATTPEGLFVAQVRANAYQAGCPGMAFFNNEGVKTWEMGDSITVANLVAADETFATLQAGGAIAINNTKDLLAFATYTDVHVFFLSFDEAGKPVLEPYTKVAGVLYGAGAGNNLKFDAANNLYFSCVDGSDLAKSTKSQFGIIALADQEPIATTPAKALLSNTSAVANIAVENNGEAVYFNLNGVRVAKANMAPGVYVKVANGKSTKVVVK